MESPTKKTNKKRCKLCDGYLIPEHDSIYEGLCFPCAQRNWSLYEKAHGGGPSYDIKRTKIDQWAKNYILARDKRCLKCKSESNLTIDHITSVANGGSNEKENLQVLCRGCNSIKGTYPVDYREVVEL